METSKPALKNQMRLTDYEKALIKFERAKKKRAQNAKNVQLYILKTAYEYECWLQKNRRGSSYSTFCDEFGASSFKGRRVLFEKVEYIRKILHEQIEFDDELLDMDKPIIDKAVRSMDKNHE